MTNQIPKDVKQLLGQMLICGFETTELPEGLKRSFADGRCGGAILFARNVGSPSQLVHLNQDIANACSTLPPWIAVDQEGGRVARLRAPFTELPPAAVLEFLDEEWAIRFGEILGLESRAVGFNFVLSPVLDVHTNPDNPIIGNRSLARDPKAVARLGMAYAQGLIRSEVMPCVKHFPGHGDTDLDSHLTLPTLSHNLQRMEEIELHPFQIAVNSNVPAIMSAHVLFTELDKTVPATLSPKILKKILREDWGYDGLIVSDDLEMKGVADLFPVEEIVLRGIESGIDLFLICREWEVLDSVHVAVEKAVKSGRITLDRLQESWTRITKAKKQFASLEKRLSVQEIDSYLQNVTEHHKDAAFFAQTWEKVQSDWN